MAEEREYINRCEGWVRHGSFLSLGAPMRWVQCENEGVVFLTVSQDKKVETLPACLGCWAECIENNIEIIKAIPIIKDDDRGTPDGAGTRR